MGDDGIRGEKEARKDTNNVNNTADVEQYSRMNDA
jgi:hypothetical protein